ncbi:hypothetical protein BB559_007001 [Furculomyces boomerangus]|uniref:Non-specific serine/threonine protein kinase n=1 Tax=Furculomyces boomerangus TaxID=61424 RepID=A0A2T9XZH9_9FUNG|nr:hypothetical protein BB559_007001 [Furculomyces boomerangus]
MNSNNLANFELYAARFSDDQLETELKFTIASELYDSLESIQQQDGIHFYSILWPSIRDILINCNVSFHPGSSEQKLRNTLLKVVQRVSTNELIRPAPKDISATLLNVVKNDNEENAILALKTLYDLHRIYRIALEGFANEFLDLTVEIYENADRVFDELMNENILSTPSGNITTPGSFLHALSPGITTDTEHPENSSKLLVKGIHSFRVISEIPVIIVSVLQTHRKLVPIYVSKLLPLVVQMLEMELNKQTTTGSNAHILQKDSKQKYRDLTKAQSKTLSFLAFFVRSFGSLLSNYKDRIAKIFIRLLGDCPSEAVDTRKEILVAGRHLVGSDLKQAFIPLTTDLLDLDRLLGKGLTSIETLRPYALSLVADFIHNVRNSLNQDQMTKAVYFYIGFVKDTQLSPHIRALSSKLLFSIIDSIAALKSKQVGQHLLTLILSSFSQVINEIAYINLEEKKNSLIRNENLESSDNQIPVSHPDSIIPKNQTNSSEILENTKSSTLSSTENLSLKTKTLGKNHEIVKFLVNESSDWIKDAKLILRSILPGCGAVVSGLIQINLITSNNIGDPSQPIEGWYSDTMLLYELEIIRSILKKGFLACTVFKTSKQNTSGKKSGIYSVTAQSDERLDINVSNDHHKLWKHCEVEFGHIDKEEKEALELFIKIFINLRPSLLQELFTSQIHHLFEILIENPSCVTSFQFLLALESTSPIMSSVLLSYLCGRFEELGGDDRKRASMMLHLFKIIFLVLTMFPDVNEPVLQPYIGKMIKYTIENSIDSRNPEFYFLLLKSLFCSIGGGRYEALYKEVVPHLHELLEMLNNMLKLNSNSPSMQDLLVEISLTVPVRLSVLLPYLPLLMYPLTLSMNAGPSLVSQGLRTLELCIDNLTREFIDPILLPVIEDILHPFWKLIENESKYPEQAQAASRILGKLGERNRYLLHIPFSKPKNSNSSASLMSGFENLDETLSSKTNYFQENDFTNSKNKDHLYVIPLLFEGLNKPVNFPILSSLQHAVLRLNSVITDIPNSEHLIKPSAVSNNLSRKDISNPPFDLIKSSLAYFIQNELKTQSAQASDFLDRWEEFITSIGIILEEYSVCERRKQLFLHLSQPMTIFGHISGWISNDYSINVVDEDQKNPRYPNTSTSPDNTRKRDDTIVKDNSSGGGADDSMNVDTDNTTSIDTKNDIETENSENPQLSDTPSKEPFRLKDFVQSLSNTFSPDKTVGTIISSDNITLGLRGLFLACANEIVFSKPLQSEPISPTNFLESLIMWCSYRHIQDSIVTIDLLDSFLVKDFTVVKECSNFLRCVKVTSYGLLFPSTIYSCLFDVISESLVSSSSLLRKIGEHSLAYLYKFISGISDSFVPYSCWLSCFSIILNKLCNYCYSSDTRTKLNACQSIKFMVSMLQHHTDWVELFSTKIIKGLLFTLKDIDEKRTKNSSTDLCQNTILQVLSLCSGSQTPQENQTLITTSSGVNLESSSREDVSDSSKTTSIATDSKSKEPNHSKNICQPENKSAANDHIDTEHSNELKEPEEKSIETGQKEETDDKMEIDNDKESLSNGNVDNTLSPQDVNPLQTESNTGIAENHNLPLDSSYKKSRHSSLLDLLSKNSTRIKRRNSTTQINIDPIDPTNSNINIVENNSEKPIRRIKSMLFHTSENSSVFSDKGYTDFILSIQKNDNIVNSETNKKQSLSNENDIENINNNQTEGTGTGVETQMEVDKNEPEFNRYGGSYTKPNLTDDKLETHDAVHGIGSDVPSKLVNLLPIFAKEISSPNNLVRNASRSALKLIANRSGKSLSSILYPLRDRLLVPIFGKPLRALPHGMQIGNIDAVTFFLSLSPPFLDINDGFVRLLSEVLALADAEDQALVSHPAQLRTSQNVLVSLRYTCICMLTAAMERQELLQDRHNVTRARIISVFFKSLYSKSQEVMQAANTGLQKVLSVQQKLPKDLLQAGLRPILLNLSDYKRLTVSSLDGLARLLQLLTNYFKVEVGRKLLDHLQNWAKPITLSSASDKSVSELPEIKIMVAILDVFYLLPPSASILLEDLVSNVISMELHLSRLLSSPFRKPLFTFLNHFPTESIKFFIPRLSNTRLVEMFVHAINHPDSTPLRTELVNYLDLLIDFYKVAESPTAVPAELGISASSSNEFKVDWSSLGKFVPDVQPDMIVPMTRLHISSVLTALSCHNQSCFYKSQNLTDKIIFGIESISGMYSKSLPMLELSKLKECPDENNDMISVDKPEEQMANRASLNNTSVLSGIMSQAEHPKTESSSGRLLLYIIVPKTIYQLSCVVFSYFNILAGVNITAASQFVLLVGNNEYLRNETVISKRLGTSISSIEKANTKLTLFSKTLDMLHSSHVSGCGKQYLIENVILPLMLEALGLSESKVDNISNLDQVAFVRTFHQKAWVSLISPGTDENSKIDDMVKTSLLQLTFQMISAAPKLVGEIRKDVIKFGWSFIRSDDSMVKHAAYVVVSAFVAAFDTPSKIVLQVFISLLRSHQPECRHLVQQALDSLLPVLDKRLNQETNSQFTDTSRGTNLGVKEDAGNNVMNAQILPIWAKWTCLVLQEQGLLLTQTYHIYQMITRHPDVFYPYRKHFLHFLTNVLSRLCLSQTSNPESKTLTLDILEMILKWDENNKLYYQNIPNKDGSNEEQINSSVDRSADKVGNTQGQDPNVITKNSQIHVEDSSMDVDSTPATSVETNLLSKEETKTLTSGNSITPSNNNLGFSEANSSNGVTVSSNLDKKINTSNFNENNIKGLGNTEYVPVLSELTRDAIIVTLVRFLCLSHELLLKIGVLDRTFSILNQYLDTQKWPSISVKIGIIERAIQQQLNNPAAASANIQNPPAASSNSLHSLLKMLTIISSEMEPAWFEENFYSLSTVFMRLLTINNSEMDSLLFILSKQLYSVSINSMYYADESSLQRVFVNDVNAFIIDNLLVASRARSTLVLLNSVSSYVNEHLAEHFGKAGRSSVEINHQLKVQDTGIHDSLTWDLALDLEPTDGIGTLLPSIYLLKLFYTELGDQRRPFITTLGNLMVRSQDAGVQYALIVLLNEWLFGDLEFSPSIKDKAMLMVSMMNCDFVTYHTSVDDEKTTNETGGSKSPFEFISPTSDNSRVSSETKPIQISKQFLGLQYLKMVARVYTTSSFYRSELTMRLEQVFLVGTMHQNNEIRNVFIGILNDHLPQSLIFRLNYFVESQNWQNVSNRYWLQLVVGLLFESVTKNISVLSLCSCASILPKATLFTDQTSPDYINPTSSRYNLSGGNNFASHSHAEGYVHNIGCPYFEGKKDNEKIINGIASKFIRISSNALPKESENLPKHFNSAVDMDSNPKECDKYKFLESSIDKNNFQDFVLSVKNVNIDSFALSVKLLAMGDINFASKVWVDLFPSMWSHLSVSQRHDYTQSLIKLLSRPYLQAQAGNNPNVVQSILEAMCNSSPVPQFPPQLLGYLGQTFNTWHSSLFLLEASMMNGSENQKAMQEQSIGAELGTFEALSELYSKLGEQHMFYGLWSRNCQYAETYASISFMQSENWSIGQLMVEQAQTKARSGALPFSEVEYSFWENEWLEAAKQLQSWDMLYELGRSESLPELGLEAGWRLMDIPAERKTIENLLESCSASYQSSSNAKFIQSFVLLASELENGDPMQNTSSSIGIKTRHSQLLEESIVASLQQWGQLPRTGTYKHLELLHMFQLQVELLDAQSIYESLSTTNVENLESRSMEIKNIIQSWRERLPNTNDPINLWSDLVAWRQHVFKSINDTYMPLVPIIINHATNSSNSTASEADNKALSLSLGLNATGGNTNGLSLNSGLMALKEAEAKKKKAESKLGAEGQRSGNLSASIPNQDHSGSSGSVATSFAYRGYHEMAWIINRFAKTARKHGLIDVSIQQLNKIYTLPNIEIQEAYLKLCGQAKCYILREQDWQTGLDAIGNTNLMYFTAPQRAEFFMLKGRFLAKQGHFDDANYAFAAGVQVDLSSGSAWSAWGRFNDERFRSHSNDISFAVNAISCYMQAAELIKHPSARRYLTRILWLLSQDNPELSLAAAFNSYKGEIPVWYWVYFVPQLLTLLQTRHFIQARHLLTRIAKQYPQSLHYFLGTTRDEIMSGGYLGVGPSVGLGNSVDGLAAGGGLQSLQPGVVHDLNPGSRVDEMISKLKTAHPLLALSVETMIDQLKQRLKPTPEEDVYRLLSTLLSSATQQLYSQLMNNNKSYTVGEKLLGNTNYILERVTEGRAKSILLRNLGETGLEKSDLCVYIESLLRCMEELSLIIDITPVQVTLSRNSPYLVEFDHQKFEEVHVPGQYLQIHESNEDFMRIERFLPKVQVSREQFTVNRVISLRTKCGKVVHFSIQHLANRHGRREERILQLYRILNAFCVSGRSLAENHKLEYSIPTIVSLAPHVRLIEYDVSSFTLLDSFVKNREHSGKVRVFGKQSDGNVRGFYRDRFGAPPLDFIFKILPGLIDKLGSTEDAACAMYYEVCKTQVSENILVNQIYRTSASVMDFWTYRKNLTFQISVASFMSYLISASSRTPQNILISRGSAKVSMLNFLPSYDLNNLIHTNDPVPFRLTPNLQALIGETGLEGILPSTLNKLASELIKPELMFRDFLEPFIQDELVAHDQLAPKAARASSENITSEGPKMDTHLTPISASNSQSGFSGGNLVGTQSEGITSEVVERNVRLILLKAEQLAPNITTATLPENHPTASALELLNQATNPSNLVKMDFSWMPWL